LVVCAPIYGESTLADQPHQKPLSAIVVTDPMLLRRCVAAALHPYRMLNCSVLVFAMQQRKYMLEE
jgi:hypothetical protein